MNPKTFCPYVGLKILLVFSRQHLAIILSVDGIRSLYIQTFRRSCALNERCAEYRPHHVQVLPPSYGKLSASSDRSGED